MRWTKQEDDLFYRYDDKTISEITGHPLTGVRSRRRKVMKTLDIFPLTKCYMCGKEFIVIVPGQWAYKRNDDRAKYFCSWHCLRAYDGQKQQKKNP